jgi:hypothetical protein
LVFLPSPSLQVCLYFFFLKYSDSITSEGDDSSLASALASEFEQHIVNELGDLQNIPLDVTMPGHSNFPYSALPLRTYSLLPEQETGVSVTDEISKGLTFQCMYLHEKRNEDEISLNFQDLVSMLYVHFYLFAIFILL